MEANAVKNAQKAAEKRAKAQQKFNDAQRKKSDAAQRYRNQLRTANVAQKNAQTTMRSA